jgi:hypothetical protein
MRKFYVILYVNVTNKRESNSGLTIAALEAGEMNMK